MWRELLPTNLTVVCFLLDSLYIVQGVSEKRGFWYSTRFESRKLEWGSTFYNGFLFDGPSKPRTEFIIHPYWKDGSLCPSWRTLTIELVCISRLESVAWLRVSLVSLRNDLKSEPDVITFEIFSPSKTWTCEPFTIISLT